MGGEYSVSTTGGKLYAKERQEIQGFGKADRQNGSVRNRPKASSSCEVAKADFDETIEAHIRLGNRRSDQRSWSRCASSRNWEDQDGLVLQWARRHARLNRPAPTT